MTRRTPRPAATTPAQRLSEGRSSTPAPPEASRAAASPGRPQIAGQIDSGSAPGSARGTSPAASPQPAQWPAGSPPAAGTTPRPSHSCPRRVRTRARPPRPARRTGAPLHTPAGSPRLAAGPPLAPTAVAPETSPPRARPAPGGWWRECEAQGRLAAAPRPARHRRRADARSCPAPAGHGGPRGDPPACPPPSWTTDQAGRTPRRLPGQARRNPVAPPAPPSRRRRGTGGASRPPPQQPTVSCRCRPGQ